ncbi:Signal transduction histidine kinase [Dehalogenimonas formicexedens]|uniref:histidine kinase n=1 Tax=Dehalogenimonas formicexedens TaxID=1839801 RepID=A0A1P8F950_9CHLR|nr:histidine kinase N-terminal 7TM domain-containing protein [Dehalogenimonas formicexedens]APV44978.1 Signal transduction histidine kinase [Dehalogenimonas formicexedens]
MNLFFDIHVILPLAALATGVILSIQVWKSRRKPLVTNFLILMASLIAWSFAAIMEQATPDLAGKTFWIYFSYFGIVPLPIAWLCFCLRYASKEKWITPRNIVAISVLPVVTLILVWTNSAHHLMWKDIWLNTSGNHPVDEVTHGAWFWVFASYSYVLLATGTWNLFNLMRHSTGIYRNQIMVMFLGTFVPWLGNALFLMAPSMFSSVDPTPLAFAITGVVFYFGLSRFHLVEVAPVARDAIFNSILDGVIVLDTARLVIDLNSAARAMLVPDHADIIGKPLASILPQLMYINFEKLPAGGQRTSAVTTRAGEQRIQDVLITGIKTHKRVSGYLVILHDNTESYKAEIARREKIVLETELVERKKAAEIVQYRLYLEQTIAGISSRFATTADLNTAIDESLSDIGYLSGASRAYLYRASEDGRSMSNTNEWCARDVDSLKHNLQNLPISKFSWWIEKLNSGETILVRDVSQLPPEAAAEKSLMDNQSISSTVAMPLRGKGKLLGFMGIDNISNSSSWTEKDLSVLRVSAEIIGSAIERHDAALELTKLNRALFRMNAQLEARVEERTRQLEETAIEANAANQAKSDFLASMSHELRTPLNAVIGFSQVLEEQIFGSLNEKQAEYVTNILGSGQHLLCLINDILDLSKIEAGKSHLELSDISIGPLIQESLLMIKEKAAKKHVKLKTSLNPGAAADELQADARKIKQVLFNLLSNAIKFTPDDGRITIEANRIDGHLRVSVSDTGIGIPSESQGKMFTDFYQVQGGLLSKTPGTGLGLAISKRLVEMHGGSIWVQSEGSNKGATFTFEIPVQQKGAEN